MEDRDLTEPVLESTIIAQEGGTHEDAEMVVAKTFEEGQQAIARLVEFYRANRHAFLEPQYTEAEARQQFIDGIFMALGWNVRNEGEGQLPPHDREVVIEQSTEVEGHRTAPDYTFRIGESRYSQVSKFIVEAKKPSVNIRESRSAARQVRAYAWHRGLPIALLTNFEELAIYNGRVAVPPREEAAGDARIELVSFEQYIDRWKSLWDTYSREAIGDGRFDHYVTTNAVTKGTMPIDDAFLQTMEDWRKRLARDIARNNPSITNSSDLTGAVQTVIDRIVFLRMAEDRGIEPDGSLQRIAEANAVYQKFVQELCRVADEKYNSDLFNFQKDKLTPTLVISDQVLRAIIQGLYFPCRYQFRLMPVEFLGSAYERFLGKVLHLTKSGVRIEDKPEVRKAGGVFYTPAYIVNYIVQHTVGEAITGKSPAQLAAGRFRVLDIACGSGSFLLGAYQFLLDYYLRCYVEHDLPNSEAKRRIWKPETAGESDWQLTIGERKRVLTTHIFGVDIDRQAVEVTKLSLLLKVLEGESMETLGRQRQLQLFQDRVLPNLAHNIKCGNSIIASDFWQNRQSTLFDPSEAARINAFDWQAEFPSVFNHQNAGFSTIIGNPPYLRMEGFKDTKDYLKAHYQVHKGRADYLVYFVERAHSLLQSGGHFGMILSNKFLKARFGGPLREFLRENTSVERVVDLAGLPVFEGATVRTIILTTQLGKKQDTSTAYAPPLPESGFKLVSEGLVGLGQATAKTIRSVPSSRLERAGWDFADERETVVLDKLRSVGQPLADYCGGHICRGVVSGLAKAFEIDSEAREKILANDQTADDMLKPLIRGRDIRRYRVDWKNKYLIYTYHGIPEEHCAAIKKHLEPFMHDLKHRATKQEWYELQQPQFDYSHYMGEAKIVFPDIAKKPRFALDEVGYYGSNTTYFIPGRGLFLLGLLNSRLSFFYFSHVCAGLEGKNETFLRFIWQYLAPFPVCRVDAGNVEACANRDRLEKLVESMITLCKAECASAQQVETTDRQIRRTDEDIDRLVYALYGLSGDEIEVIEDATGSRQ